MSSPHLVDLEYLFWGGGQSEKYAALKAFAEAGVNALDVLAATQTTEDDNTGDFGIVRSFQITNMTTGALGFPNRTNYVRVVGSGTITKLGIHIGVASGNITAGVYANTGTGRSAKPGAAKAVVGSIPCPAAGYAEIVLPAPVQVEHGDWFAVGCDNTTATFFRIGGAADGPMLAGLSWKENVFPAPAIANPLGLPYQGSAIAAGVP
jgi:hypothetical protein